MIKPTRPPSVQFLERVGFGIIILGGYILAMGTLAFFPIPQENLQLFSQGIGALGTAVGVIVAAIWKSRWRPTPDGACALCGSLHHLKSGPTARTQPRRRPGPDVSSRRCERLTRLGGEQTSVCGRAADLENGLLDADLLHDAVVHHQDKAFKALAYEKARLVGGHAGGPAKRQVAVREETHPAERVHLLRPGVQSPRAARRDAHDLIES